MTGSPKSSRDERLIAALLSEPTVAAAAKTAGMSERTARRRLAEADFQAAYRDARAQAVTGAVGRLQGLLAKAAGTLERAMDSGSPAVEVRAAVAAFDLAYRGAELLDLAERVEALETVKGEQ